MARPGNTFRMTKRSKIVPKWLYRSPTNRRQTTATEDEEWTEQKLDRLLDMLIREGLVEGEVSSVVPASHPWRGHIASSACCPGRTARSWATTNMTDTSGHTGDVPPS